MSDKITDKLLAALRELPDDAGMIEHNPDEGMRMFCCDGKIAHRFSGSDRVEHAADCWFAKVRTALADYENDRGK